MEKTNSISAKDQNNNREQKISVSFSKFELAVSDSPPPVLASVRSRNTAKPQTRLSDLSFKGHRLPVQSLQSEGFP